MKSILNILPEEILIKIYKECFKETLIELKHYHITKNLYDDVIEEIDFLCEGLLCNFDFEDIVVDDEDVELIGISYMMLLQLHDLIDDLDDFYYTF